MARPEVQAAPPVLDEERWSRRRRWAIFLWAVFAVVIWNVVFDAYVIQAGRDYLDRQQRYLQGQATATTIPAFMHPAVRQAAQIASLWGGGVALVGALGIWVATRQRRRLPLS